MSKDCDHKGPRATIVDGCEDGRQLLECAACGERFTTSAKIDLDELDRKARAAPQQLWCAVDSCTPSVYVDVHGDGCATEDGFVASCATAVGEHERQTADEQIARHIAANSPPVTLALIARIRELYDVAYSALSLIAVTERGDAWSAELARIKAALGGVVAVFGDSVVGSVEVVEFERGAS